VRGLQKYVEDAYFGGETLRGADSRIHSVKVRQEIVEKANFEGIPGFDGRRMRGSWREKMRLTISFSIFETQDAIAREMAVEAANAWARDGYLEIVSKPDRRILVACNNYAAIKEPENPEETFSLVFETVESPYWEDVRPVSFRFSGYGLNDQIRAPGTKDVVADVTVVPQSGTLNSLQIQLGETVMSFSGLGVNAGAAFVIDHDEFGNLRISSEGVSKYSCRDGSSDDGFASCPGPTTVAFQADTPCEVTFLLRGRYL